MTKGTGQVGEKTSSKRETLLTLAAVLLFALGVMLLPARRFGGLFLNDEESAFLLGGAIFRTVGFVVAWIAAKRMGLRLFRGCTPKGLLLCLPFIAVVAGNYPIGALAGGDVTLSLRAARFCCFLYYCIAVGLFEEIVFRGIALPCVLLFFNGRFRLFWAAAVSSAVFALCHLINLLGGVSGDVFLQVGYSFLVGGMCALTYFLCPNILLCIGLHALFDVGGFMATYLGSGMVWGTLDIVLTAVTAVGGTAYALWLFFTYCKDAPATFWEPKSAAGEDDATKRIKNA